MLNINTILEEEKLYKYSTHIAYFCLTFIQIKIKHIFISINVISRMLLLYYFLLGLPFAVLGAVPDEFLMNLREFGIGFESNLDDYGSVTLSMKWIRVVGAFDDHGSSFLSLQKSRLTSFLENLSVVSFNFLLTSSLIDLSTFSCFLVTMRGEKNS